MLCPSDNLPFFVLYLWGSLDMYRSIFCISLFFMCGTIGLWGASQFVKKIYSNVKID
jgi:hypothetical protein